MVARQELRVQRDTAPSLQSGHQQQQQAAVQEFSKQSNREFTAGRQASGQESQATTKYTSKQELRLAHVLARAHARLAYAVM